MPVVRFTVAGKTEPAGSKTNMPRRKFPWVVSSVRDLMAWYPLVDANSKAAGWKAVVGGTAKGALLRQRLQAPVFDCPLTVQMTFRRTRPKSHFTTKGVLNAEGRSRPFPDSKPDVLKLARAVEDAMTGIVYSDDAKIVRELIEKEWGDRDEVEVLVFETVVEREFEERDRVR